jgi:predicted AAA+ superfamily ATPase
MNQTINQYVQNQLSRAPLLLQSYTQDEQGNKYLTRNAFIRLQKQIRDFSAGQQEVRIIAVPGLRGVGKTTLLAQLFMDLYAKQPRDLFYVSADQIVNVLNSDLNTVFEELQTVLGTSFEALDRKLYLFIDEIHFDKNWTSILKMLFDRSKNVFIICTGSSALSLQSTADLARRVVFEKLYPMNFTEFMLLKTKYHSLQNKAVSIRFPVKGLKEALKQSLFASDSAEACFTQLQQIQSQVTEYWSAIDRLEIDRFVRFGTMPFALTIQDETRTQVLTNQLIDKVVEKDLSDQGKFNKETLESIKNILLMVAASSEVSFTSMTKSLSNLAVNTLIEVFNALERAELLIRVYPYGSAYKKVRKPSKYHFMTPAVRHALLMIVEGDSAFSNNKGKYLEDIVALTLYREFGQRLASPLFYDSAQGGADFILSFPDKKIAIEVGYGNKKIEQAKATLVKIKGQYGLIVSNSQLAIEDNVVKVPLEYFLLM